MRTCITSGPPNSSITAARMVVGSCAAKGPAVEATRSAAEAATLRPLALAAGRPSAVTVPRPRPTLLTSRTLPGPKSFWSAPSVSASGSTRSERERSRGARSPLSDPTWIQTLDGPGCSARTRCAASNASSGRGAPSSSSIWIASSGFTSSRGRALSRKIGGSSSSRSRPLTRPVISTTASWTRSSLYFCHASPKASTVAVPWKSSTVTLPHSAPSRLEICRATDVTTQGSATRLPGCSTSVSDATGSYARTYSR